MPGPITFSSTYGGEDFDARREPQGSDRPGFDDASSHDAAWSMVPAAAPLPELPTPIRVMHVYATGQAYHPTSQATVYDLRQKFAGWPEITIADPPEPKSN